MNPVPHAPTPDTPPPAWDRIRLLQLIEDAERETRFCVCGSMMQVTAQGDVLELACPAFQDAAAGRLGWLRDGLRSALHDRRVITRGLATGA